MWEYMVRMTVTSWFLSKGQRDFSSPGIVQPESEAIHLPASGAEVKMHGISIRVHGVVLMRTSYFSEEFCAKRLFVGLFHCQDEEQFYA
jgi:hypothetical protein